MNRSEILAEADRCVSRDREAEYGGPRECLGTAAQLWTSYLQTLAPIVELTAADVAQMMVLLKVARAATGTPKPDTYVDQAGYAALAGELSHP